MLLATSRVSVRTFVSSVRRALPVGPKRTRKKKADLPETLAGHAATPLPEWQGGLKGRNKRASTPTRPRSTSSGTQDKKTRVTRKTKPKNNTVPLAEEPRIGHHPNTDLAIEIFQNLARFPNCILLTRVGQFYESYFEQAETVSKLLNIKLTSKTWGGGPVPFCGFPLSHLDKHLKALILSHKRYVALCEEFKVGDGKFERRVTRVLTPGTLIDEAFLDPYENNYILSISCATDPTACGAEDMVGLAWMDVSTGEFFSQVTTVSAVRDEIARIGPKEVVLSSDLKPLEGHPIRQIVVEEGSAFLSFPKEAPPSSFNPETYNLSNEITHPSSLLPQYTPAEMVAIEQLTTFLHENLLEHMPKLSRPLQQGAEARMQIDAHTIKSLEIKQGLREGGTKGTLLNVINRTTTSSGTRLLSQWICSPSTSVSEITTRQSIVAFFVSRPYLRADIVSLLRKIEDTARIVQKFLSGKGEMRDLRNVGSAIGYWEALRERFELERKMEEEEQSRTTLREWKCIDSLLTRMSTMKELSRRISAAVMDEVDEEPLYDDRDEEDKLDPLIVSGSSKSKEPTTVFRWHIKPSYSTKLQKLHAKLEKLRNDKDELELGLRSQFYANTLSLRVSPQLGFHVHVKKKDAAQIPRSEQFKSLSESRSTKTFFSEIWYKLGTSIADTCKGIMEMERAAFNELRDAVAGQAAHLRQNARIIDEIDVTLGFAELAVEMNFTRPTVDSSTKYHVVNGRHPTVELGLLGAGRLFVPNTVSLDSNSNLHVITGPNMAGKSTLLRQTALIAILAQTGSFVPADSARIGIIDRLFSRVGANDDLFRDRSTFMVEMMETAEILNRATPRSLVIMDEVGRGTSMSTGLAIAFATVHHLYTKNKSRTLFATHFHEIADMLGYDEESRQVQGSFNRIAFFCTDVDETESGSFTYSHRIRPGVNRDSHGLKVAQLGGMPTSALQVASTALKHLVGRDQQTWLARAEELKTLGAKLVSVS